MEGRKGTARRLGIIYGEISSDSMASGLLARREGWAGAGLGLVGMRDDLMMRCMMLSCELALRA